MAAIAKTQRSAASTVLNLIARPFLAIGRGLALFTEAQTMQQELARLNRTSDEQLAGRGLSREGEIRRILGSNYYV